MPVESSKGCNTALKSCCSVLVHSAHIDTEPPIFFDVDAKADPFDTTMDRPAMVVKATAAIRALRDAFTLPNDFLLITPLLVVVISFMRPAPLPPEESEGLCGPPRCRKAWWSYSPCSPGNFLGDNFERKFLSMRLCDLAIEQRDHLWRSLDPGLQQRGLLTFPLSRLVYRFRRLSMPSQVPQTQLASSCREFADRVDGDR